MRYTQTKLFVQAFAGCNWQVRKSLMDQLIDTGYQQKKGEKWPMTLEETVNQFISDIDPKNFGWVDYHDMIIHSGYPEPNDKIYNHCATIYYYVENQT